MELNFEISYARVAKSKMSHNREKIIAQVEKRLSRKLSEREFKALKKLDLGVLNALAKWKDEEGVADLVKTFSDGDATVTLMMETCIKSKTAFINHLPDLWRVSYQR